MVGGNNSDGASVSPVGRYRVVFGRGDVHRYACEATRVQLCSVGIVVPVGIVAVLMIVASVAWESWVWAALVPPYVVVAAGLSYWSSRRMYAHVVGPGMTMTIGADDYGLIIESQAGRDAFPWERIAGVRFGRGIAMLTIVKPKARMLLPAELLPAALLAQFPARDRGRGGDRW